jgi:hypothetical protein
VTAVDSQASRTVSTPELLYELRQRSRAVQARGRIAESLYTLALDIFGDDSELHPAERQWLAQALATPVSEAADEAVDTLLRELALTLGSAPPRVRPGIAGTAPLRRIDFE